MLAEHYMMRKDSLWYELFNVYRQTRLAMPLKLALEQHNELIQIIRDKEVLVDLVKVAPFLFMKLNLDDAAMTVIKLYEDAIYNMKPMDLVLHNVNADFAFTNCSMKHLSRSHFRAGTPTTTRWSSG